MFPYAFVLIPFFSGYLETFTSFFTSLLLLNLLSSNQHFCIYFNADVYIFSFFPDFLSFYLPILSGHRTSSGSWHGQCPHCDQDYSNISSLKYHVRLFHSDAKNSICCYLCSAKFFSKISFKDHLFTEHQVKYQ